MALNQNQLKWRNQLQPFQVHTQNTKIFVTSIATFQLLSNSFSKQEKSLNAIYIIVFLCKQTLASLSPLIIIAITIEATNRRLIRRESIFDQS